MSLGSESPLTVLLDRAAIQRRVEELGLQISKELSGSDLCVMPVMDGGMIFAADLLREIDLPLTITPIKASSYGDATASSGAVLLPYGITDGISGKDLLLVDDILDTGLTLNVMREKLIEVGAKTIRTCVLLRKESSRHLTSDYSGFEIPDKYVVGYGLDHAGLYRNLPDISVLNQEPKSLAQATFSH
jgi:hypoxanthine phosphoribosyltransferase